MMMPIVILAIENEEDRLFMQQLYETYYPLMIRQARNLTRNKYDAEDAVNDAFLSLIKHISTIQGLDVGKLRGYVVSTIMNTCRDKLKKQTRRKRKEIYESEDVLERLQSQIPDVDDRLLRDVDVQAVKAALDKLPEAQSTLLEMKYMLGLPNDEIAEHFGIKPASVRQSLTNARRKLLQVLTDNAEERSYERNTTKIPNH